jgi:hypothetical protein
MSNPAFESPPFVPRSPVESPPPLPFVPRSPVESPPPPPFVPRSPVESPPPLPFVPRSPVESPPPLVDAAAAAIEAKAIEAAAPEAAAPEAAADKQRKQFTLEEVLAIHMSDTDFRNGSEQHELEVRFGTKGKKRITKIDFDNVIRKLKSLGFETTNPLGNDTLKIQTQFTDVKTGRTKMSNVRFELNGLATIQTYCKTNTIPEVGGDVVNYVMKSNVVYKGDTVFPINQPAYNLRIAYQREKKLDEKSPLVRQTVREWDNLLKGFRYINRVAFTHPDYPVVVDLSMVKTVTGRGTLAYSLVESGVLEAEPHYEIEIEVQNSKLGTYDSRFQTPKELGTALKKVIKFVLSGLQNTNYPIGYDAQRAVLNDYYTMLHGKEKTEEKRFYVPRDFCGPQPATLELKNVQPQSENTVNANIRDGYTVTEKADGSRKLLFIASDGKIYLLTTNMEVEFTGLMVAAPSLFNTLLDGEHILHNKTGGFINLYAAFDLYYLKGDSVRDLAFVPTDLAADKSKFRLTLLKNVVEQLGESIKTVTGAPRSFNIEVKNFYMGSIFESCRRLLQKEEDGLFDYETDGLIFTPIALAVGGTTPGGAPSKPVKTTWQHAFKWKPPEFNTIDFLVSVKRDQSGQDTIGNVFKDGLNMGSADQLIQYKVLTLRCGFDEEKHGFVNPCLTMTEGRVGDYKKRAETAVTSGSKDNSDTYKPVAFYPTNPYDNEAHICHQLLEKDKSDTKQMLCENGDIIEDNTIVEFRYAMDRAPRMRWVPLRVRYDKTAELRAGQRNFGNAYHVANSNWHSIHHPVTAAMLTTGEDVPPDVSDIYYNRDVARSRKTDTQPLRDFHNLVVKRSLIEGVASSGDTLIDFAVGKAGDLSKWTAARLGFVFGIDVSKDNLENRLDGACARYINYAAAHNRVPEALFVNGNSALNIRNGDAIPSEKGKAITKSVFGEIPKNPKLGAGVEQVYAKGKDGFDMSTCMFALHYFFENKGTFEGFLTNVAECTKLGGYFVGCCYDGKLIFDALRDKALGESCCILKQGGEKIWELVKDYSQTEFPDDASSLGYAINVYQDSINNFFKEYLVNFDLLVRAMENYGFKLIAPDEAADFGLAGGLVSFKDMFEKAQVAAKRDRRYAKQIGQALKMTPDEKYISFFNKYFVFKKVANVDTTKVTLEARHNAADEAVAAAAVAPEAEAEVAEAVTLAPKAKPAKKRARKSRKKLVIAE